MTHTLYGKEKKDGSPRYYVDYKVFVNDETMTAAYPLPDMETLFHKLNLANLVRNSQHNYRLQLQCEAFLLNRKAIRCIVSLV